MSKVFEWKKIGLLHTPTYGNPLQRSHCQVPVAFILPNQTIRVFFSSRDEDSHSRIFFVDISTCHPYKVVNESVGPILDLGPLGAFDDSGVMPTWVIEDNGLLYLYYIGWNDRKTVPYQNSIGLAFSKDNGNSFVRAYPGPIIDRTKDEPFFVGTTCVLKDGELWRCWYMSSTGWVNQSSAPEPTYNIKYAQSFNGVDWVREQKVAIDFKSPDEGGIVKASVLRFKDGYSMWYSYRDKFDFRENKDKGYKIGYAESLDGISWQRMDDKVGLPHLDNKWDGQMMCYPHVIKLDSKLLMFYNGNSFGKEGFCMAIAENPYL